MEQTVPARLREFFAGHPRAALAFSGGVDSAYLLYAAQACGCRVRAYYVQTAFQPAFEAQDAERLARQLGAELQVLHADILDVEAVRQNPADRCYHCKNALFTRICAAAAADGFDLVMDGTNASDDADDRPGMRALRELGVVSPLRLCGITKQALRQYSKDAGLFTWDKPAYACLATRIPTGTVLRAEDLRVVEQAEDAVRALGFTDFRVRITPDGGAKLQVPASQWDRAAGMRRQLGTALAAFPWACLDFKTR